MEAAPRLPMISFDLFSSRESVQFGKKLKPYIANFYNEDPEAYITEISKLDTLRASATHPSMDISGLQQLKKYYCQLHFLKSRFPMEPGQPCYIEFEWKDSLNISCTGGINFELMAILHNIGALHTILSGLDSRSNPEGMKMACSHFQCAVWAFQTLKEKYSEEVSGICPLEVPHFYKQVCLAQAQECILEKSMLDNRKSTIISKVAVQVWDFYRQALAGLKSIDNARDNDLVGRNRYTKEWAKYLQFKIAYHRCISLLFQGQQAEELQKMGERVAFYQGALDHLQEAYKYLSNKQSKELADALAFTTDVVEGKRKAAKNENEYIYHEEVPELTNLQEAKGASLVKGIEFSVNDPEVSGPDIFARLVPMEAHEAASVYSEKKAEVLRNIGQRVEIKDQALVEFMSSMQLDILTKMHQASGIPQELIDRAASLSAKPSATQALVDSMAWLSNIYHDVEANLNEIDALLKEEEDNEKNYQEIMGKRPPSIITTDLAREAFKYKEAHSKAKESNETLSKAMMTHLENLKILQRPIRELQKKLPSVELPDPNIDQETLKELELLNSKVDEMKSQRAMLWAQLRDAIHNDDITNALVTKQPNQSLDDVFGSQLEKHGHLIEILDQNLHAQDNIKKAFVDCYARAVNTRRYIQDIIQKRNSTIQALMASHDSYDDLLAKATKGIEFYTKLEVNVSKLLQRIKSASKVQQEEREQMLAKNVPTKKVSDVDITPVANVASAPKLKDYLEARKKAASYSYPVDNTQNWPPGVRPTPVGSEINTEPTIRMPHEAYYQQVLPQNYSQANNDDTMNSLTNQMGALLGKHDPVYSYSSYTPQNYTPASYSYASQHYTDVQGVQSPTNDASKASTLTTNTYNQIISSLTPGQQQQYSSNGQFVASQSASSGQYSQYSQMQYPQNQTQQQQQDYPPQQQQYSQSQTPQQQYPQSQTPQQQQQYAQSQTLQQQKQYPQSQTPQQYTQTQQYPQTQTPQQQQYPQIAQQPEYPRYVYGQQQASQYPQSPSISQTPSGYSQASTGYTQAKEYTSLSYLRQYGAAQSVPSSQAGGSYESSNVAVGMVQPGIQGTEAQSTGLHYGDSLSAYPQYQATQTNTAQQSYFPQGYAPNYNNPSSVSSENTFGMPAWGYQQQYYTQRHSSSVAQDITKMYSTYSSPTSEAYKIQPNLVGGNYIMSSATAQSGQMATSTGAGTAPTGTVPTAQSSYYPYGSVYGYQNQGTHGNSMAYPVQVGATAVAPQHVATSKESNVDLLTGLDFSATSNIPTLTPQPNVVPEKQKEPEKAKIVEGKVHQPSLKTPETLVTPSPKKNTIRVLPSKPLNNNEVKSLFSQELEKFEKYVETLTTKTLSGPTTLDVKWKEIQENQELDNQKKVISIARCYPMKNRYPDILPYDYSRVELRTTKDDYINASFIQQICLFGPEFIVTQAPLASSFGEFWAMVREQQVELIFCLLNDNEIGDDVYWPKEKGQNLTILNQNLVISLQSVVTKTHWTERIICLSCPERKESWVVVHLQFTSWPGSLFPTTPEPFISYIIELIALFQQQKSISHPLLVHCSSGIGRSGLTCLLTNAILEVTNQSTSIPDLALMTAKLGNFRKNILRDREHLKFAHEALLGYMKQLLMQDNLKKKLSEVVPVKEEENKANVVEVQETIIDPLSTLDPFWASKK